jgi:hypothetical protein
MNAPNPDAAAISGCPVASCPPVTPADIPSIVKRSALPSATCLSSERAVSGVRTAPRTAPIDAVPRTDAPAPGARTGSTPTTAPATAINPADKPAPSMAPVPASPTVTPATRRGTIDRSLESNAGSLNFRAARQPRRAHPKSSGCQPCSARREKKGSDTFTCSRKRCLTPFSQLAGVPRTADRNAFGS